MEKKLHNFNHLMYIAIGLGLTAIFHFASGRPENETGYFHGINYNLLVYVAALALAFTVFLILSFSGDFISGRLADSSTDEAEKKRRTPAGKFADAVLYIIYGCIAAGVLILIYEIYINECNLYPGDAAPTYLRQLINHRCYFVAIFIIAAILFFTLSRDKEEKQNRSFRIGLGLMFSLLNAVATWCPNIFSDTGGGVIHIHAVFNSIVNVARLQPYSQTNCSIYGHFGLIFLPFVKLLGNNLTAISLSISLFTFIAFAAAFYTADKLIRRDVIYFIALAGITGTTTLLTRRGQYFQINPLRLLFPMLMLAVITFCAHHQNGRTGRRTGFILLEIITGVLSVIWNFETGLFSVCVCALIIILRSLYDGKLFSRKMWLSVLRAFLFGTVCLAGAYAAVNVYNLLVGGSLNSIRLFIYPLMSGTYNVNHLRCPLPSVKFLYFFQILLFFLTALIVLRRQHLQETDNQAADTVRFAVAMSGLSSLIYFINRAAYGNMSIAHIQMVLLLASWGQNAIAISKKNARRILGRPASFLPACLSVILFGGLVWMAIEGTLYIEVCCEYRAKSSWQTESLESGIEELKNELPEDCWAFGYCVPELWYQMGWENVIYMTDWSDINDYNIEYVREEIQKHDMVVCSVDDFTISGYHVEKEVAISSYHFRLWVRDGYTWDQAGGTVAVNGSSASAAAETAADDSGTSTDVKTTANNS